jgi:uncharacterized protein (DUF58 family)
LLTSRGWWFLFIALVQAAVGAAVSPQFGDGVAVIAFVLLAWFLWEWATFAYRLYFVLPGLQIEREIRDDRKVVPLLWADTEFDVHVRVVLPGPGDLPFAVLSDWVPTDASFVEGADEITVALAPDAPATIRYRLKCPRPGELRFEGLRVRIADRQGFFYHRTFVREDTTFLVLPRLTGAEKQGRGFKKHNIFPPPGVHRLKRPGGGSELLDLRDYIPGDPPKMIAWKPSARKDKLFIKEFESEVPVRCTLFVDASEATRLGAKRTKITRLANLAAGVAEATVADRDHAGLVVFDEHDTSVMRPKRSRRHVIDMLHRLAEAAARPTPIGPFADASALGRLAHPLAAEMYPQLMNRKVNTTPFGLFWSPISDYRRGWLVLAFWLPMIFLILNYLARQVGVAFRIPDLYEPSWSITQSFGQQLGAWWFDLGIFGRHFVLKAYAWAAVPALIGTLIWLFFGLSGLMNPWRSERVRRKQLGLLFATLDNDRPGAETHYLSDDQVFARRAMRFLADHHARYPVRLYDARGRYLFHSRPKLAVLANALNYAVARGRDNELFVLLADLTDLADEIEPLIRSVRVAVARHHQVLVIVPWQDDIPDPPREPPKDDGALPTARAERFALGGLKAIADDLQRDAVEHYHRSYFRLRKAFGRLGVPVIRADQGEPVQAVLDRLDRLRGVGRRR